MKGSKSAFTARISNRSRSIAKEIMRDTGERQIDVIEHALLVYRRQWRMEKLSEDFERLKKNTAEWSSYKKETEELDGTIADGLETDD